MNKKKVTRTYFGNTAGLNLDGTYSVKRISTYKQRKPSKSEYKLNMALKENPEGLSPFDANKKHSVPLTTAFNTLKDYLELDFVTKEVIFKGEREKHLYKLTATGMEYVSKRIENYELEIGSTFF